MSWLIRSITPSRVTEVYSSNESIRARCSDQGPGGQAGVRDSVRISDAALKKFRQSREEKSSGAVPEKHPEKNRDKDLEESLKALGIDSTDATMEEIRKAFILAIKKYHPDNYSDSPPETRKLAELKTRRIIEAYRKIDKRS
ncbi:MAG: hypothetical protein WAW37_10830 [Syntrophobacteraceae bacterium]